MLVMLITSISPRFNSAQLPTAVRMSDRRSAPADKGCVQLAGKPLKQTVRHTRGFSGVLRASCPYLTHSCVIVGLTAACQLQGFFPFSRWCQNPRVKLLIVNCTPHRWTYQGSNAQSRVDFWHKDGVKLDYYPTTGVSRVAVALYSLHLVEASHAGLR